MYTKFVWFDNYIALFKDPLYLKSIVTTLVFSGLVATVSISFGLFLATMANRVLKATTFTRTLLIWPYAIAPAISGILWLFLLHPSYGVVAIFIEDFFGIDWNPLLESSHAMLMIVMASAWKNVSYNFVFFLQVCRRFPFAD